MSLQLFQIFLLFLLVKKSIELSFECHYENFNLYGFGIVYFCTTSIRVWDLDDENINYINGTHMPGKNNLNVQGITFVSPSAGNELKMDYVPKNILSFFPNLNLLEIYVFNGSKLSSNDLKPYPNLEHLAIQYSLISTISGDLFQNTPKMKVISFWNNAKLSHVGENLLGNLQHLEGVWFVSNKCINIQATDPTQIAQLKQNLLTNCPPLVEIDYCPSSCNENFDKISKTNNISLKKFEEKLQEKLESQNKIIEKQQKDIQTLKTSLSSFECFLNRF